MAEKRIRVWVQLFGDRPYLMLQWYDPTTGKRKSKSAETCNPKDAETARADLEADLNAGRYQEASRITWPKFRELFEAEYVSGKRKNTRTNYADTLDAFEEVARPHLLRAVTERTVSGFVAGLRKKPCRGREGLMPSTIAIRVQFLRTALRWAVSQKLLPSCPKFPRIKVPERFPQPVPAESFETLSRHTADPLLRAFLLCGWLAGLRLSEAFALEWEPTQEAPFLDPGSDRIVLPAAMVKADRDQWVPLDAHLYAVLRELPRTGPKVFLFIGKHKRPVTLATISDRIGRLAKRCGVKLTMHSLRRGFGCRYAGKVPAQVLQKLMRHRSIKTTLDYYANVDDAVMNAVLGDNRNGSRNKPDDAPPRQESGDGATDEGDGTSVRS